MSKTEKITKFRQSLKSPLYVNPEASFQPKKKMSARASSPKSRSPSPKPASPSRAVSLRKKSITSIPESIPGMISSEEYEYRAAVQRPSAERYANLDILKKNPKITMEELSLLLGVTKINLPEIDTRLKPLPLPAVKETKSPKLSPLETAASPARSSKSASPRKTAKSPTRKGCNIMLGGVPMKKEMISTERSTKANPYYKIEELKEIAKQLGISSSGTKDVLVSLILKELESRGC